MAEPLPPAVAAFRALFAVGRGSFDAALLGDDVTLRPPTYSKEWRGRPLVARLLDFAADALGGLLYTDIWSDGARHVLRFEGTIGGQPISGVDVVTTDAQGRIVEVEIFARPPKAVLLLRDAMGQRVAADPGVGAAMGLT